MRAFDGFEVEARDGLQIVVEIPDCGLQAAVAEDGLHVAHVVRVAKHGDGGGAAQVVGHDVAGDAVGLAKFLEGVAERCGESAAICVELELAAVAVRPELQHEGPWVAQVALVDEFADGARDGQREARTVLAGEAELAGLRVVFGGPEARGCAGTDGEVRTEEYPQAQVGRRVGHQAVDFFAVGGDVARPCAGIAPDVLVELGRAVVLPQPAKDGSYGTGLASFRGALIATTREGVVDFFGVRRGDLVGRDAASSGDDGLGSAAILPFPVVEECGE